MEYEYTRPVCLTDSRGRPCPAGYGRRAELVEYRRGTLPLLARRREWESYLLLNPRWTLEVAAGDVGGRGRTLLFAARRDTGEARLIWGRAPWSAGSFRGAVEGDIALSAPDLSLVFRRSGEGHILLFHTPQGLDGQLYLPLEAGDCLWVASPLSVGRGGVSLTMAAPCPGGEGRMTWGADTLPAGGDCRAVRMTRQGTFPAGYSGVTLTGAGADVTVHLGALPTPEVTENALFYRGTLHKLGPAVWRRDGSGRVHVHTAAGDAALCFTPQGGAQQRVGRAILTRQAGTLTGWVRLASGEVLRPTLPALLRRWSGTP